MNQGQTPTKTGTLPRPARRPLHARPPLGLADLGVPVGIGELDRTLLEHRLLDELYFSKATVAVGRGERLLGASRRPSSCSRQRRFGRGIVVLKYAPRR